MKPIKMIKMLLSDPKHWIGWALTVGAIVGLFHLLGIHGVHDSVLNIGLLASVVVVVDISKHLFGLQ